MVVTFVQTSKSLQIPLIIAHFCFAMLAALQAPIILMSQNRQAMRDRLAAGLDYEVNLKAEIEIMGMKSSTRSVWIILRDLWEGCKNKYVWRRN